RSESVFTTMFASALREHEGTRTRAPSSSTTQTRQTFTGVRFSAKQSVGVEARRALGHGDLLAVDRDLDGAVRRGEREADHSAPSSNRPSFETADSIAL